MIDIITILIWLLRFVVVLLLFAFIGATLRFRLPKNLSVVRLEGEVLYRMVNFDFTVRAFYENVLSNRLLHLSDNSQIYISKEAYQKLWAESPLVMKQKHYSYRVAVSVRPLWFGGYGRGHIQSITKIDAAPIIYKS